MFRKLAVPHVLRMVLVLMSAAQAETDVDVCVAAMPDSLLRTEYHPLARQPLQYIGYSFSGTGEELMEMREAGANALGAGEMWNPVRDPKAPYGLGVTPPDGSGKLAQTFVAEKPFDGCGGTLPTSMSTDSGCAWRLFRQGDDEPLAEGAWALLVDNAWADAYFAQQPPGAYRFELCKPTGSSVGWWARPGNPYENGQAIVGGEVVEDLDFEMHLRIGSTWQGLIPPGQDHRAHKLGPSVFDHLTSLGMYAAYSIGNWNNPGFTYYPDWFFDEFPEAAVLDQYGKPFYGGSMFEREVPSPNIDSAVIVNGTHRMVQSRAEAYRHSPALLYYVMGGEDLYATYITPMRWTDYSENAQAHFRAWLASVRYDSLEALNRAWGTAYTAFDDVEAPKEPAMTTPWMDWLDFRFEAMGERFGWHYQAIREADPTRLVMTCNHGTLYHGTSYAAMGARIELYAAQSDGFETGQIMEDEDPDFYNLLYTESITGMGKPYCPVRLAYKESNPAARGGGTSYNPPAVRRYGYETLGSGAWHLGFIQWSGSLPDGEWGVKGTPGERATAEFHAEIRKLAPILDGLHAVRPNMAVFLSHPTWALEGFLPAWHDLHKAAIKHHVPKSYVYDGQVLHGQVDDYPVMVSVDNTLVDEAVVKGLLRYVEQGGRLVVAGGLGSANGLPESLKDHPRVTWLAETTPGAILEALGEAAVPLPLRGIGTTRRPVGLQTAAHMNHRPDDMASAKSLGQTVRVDHEGLLSASITTPTYTKTPDQGFRLEGRLDGPSGKLIAGRDVPPGIGDNAWVDLVIENPPAAGSVLYISATAPEDLPAQTIGWWTANGDPYPAGQAYVDGEPVDGDRRVKLAYEAPTPAADAVEMFLLSDGLNYGVVLVNIGLDPVELELDLGALALASIEPPTFTVRSCLRENAWRGDGLAGRVRIPGQDAEVLYLEWDGGKTEARELLFQAEASITSFYKENAATPYACYALLRALDHLDAECWPKTAAYSLQMSRQLGLAVSCPGELPAEGTAQLVARFLDRDGKPLDVDVAHAELTPTQGIALPLRRESEGVYTLDLSQDALPKLYNYATQSYEPYGGPLRIRVSGKKGPLRASTQVDVMAVGVRYPAGPPVIGARRNSRRAPTGRKSDQRVGVRNAGK